MVGPMHTLPATSSWRSLPRWPMALAAAFALLVVGAAAWCGLSYFDSINGLTRGSVAGTVEFAADRNTRVVVYYEGHATPALADLNLRVTGPAGESVPLQAFSYDLRYDINDRAGHAVAVFDAPVAGTYTVASTVGEPGARLAVGGDLGGATLRMVFAVMAAFLALSAGALAALVWFAIRRRPPLATSFAR